MNGIVGSSISIDVARLAVVRGPDPGYEESYERGFAQGKSYAQDFLASAVAGVFGRAASVAGRVDNVVDTARTANRATDTARNLDEVVDTATENATVVPTSIVKIPSAADTKLQNYIDQLFKHANKPGRIGDGTTMAALPSELAAGSGPHIQKATEIRNGLRKWLTSSRGQNASAADRAIAQDLFNQLDELLP